MSTVAITVVALAVTGACRSAPKAGPSHPPSVPTPSSSASLPSVEQSLPPATFSGDTEAALDGLPPREDLEGDALVAFDNLTSLMVQYRRVQSDIPRLDRVYRKLLKKSRAAAAAYRRGSVPYSVTIKANSAQGRAWDRQFDARGEANALALRIDRAREILDERLALSSALSPTPTA